MNFKDLFDVLPDLFNLFIPGFVFLVTYKYFIDEKDKGFDITAIGSIVLSYIFQVPSTLICNWINISGNWITIITITLSFICAILTVKIRLTKVYRNIVKWIGKTTGNKNVWYDIFDLNKGTRIRFFAKFNNQDVTVEGDVKYFEACDDGECNIVISNYKIHYSNDNVYENKTESATIVYNTKNIHGLEAHRGQ